MGRCCGPAAPVTSFSTMLSPTGTHFHFLWQSEPTDPFMSAPHRVLVRRCRYPTTYTVYLHHDNQLQINLEHEAVEYM